MILETTSGRRAEFPVQAVVVARSRPNSRKRCLDPHNAITNQPTRLPFGYAGLHRAGREPKPFGNTLVRQPLLSVLKRPRFSATHLTERRWWPPLGRSHGHQRAVFMTATGQFLLSLDTR